MKATATVVETDGIFAVVESKRTAACDGCHKKADGKDCSVCTLMGGNRNIRTRAENAVGAKVGDRVEIESSSVRILGYAALVFLLPLALGFGFYLIGRSFLLGDIAQFLFSLVGFVIAFIIIFIYSKTVMPSRCDAKIISVISSNGDDLTSTD